MSKVTEMMIRRDTPDQIEIGQICERFYNGQAGEIFRAMVNGRIKEQISQTHDIKTPADRLLGRAEGIQMIQDDIELAIEQMYRLTAPLEKDDEEKR